MNTCKVPGCGRQHDAHGLCRTHYERLRTTGDVRQDEPVAEKGRGLQFLRDTVLPYAGDECILWPFARNSEGYGHVIIDGKLEYVHRFVCREQNGPPPSPSHEAAHSCGRGHMGCCTKSHLRWATAEQNMADAIAHGTTLRGSRHPLAKLGETEARQILALKSVQTQEEIARTFGVSRELVSRIHRGVAWAWLQREQAA